MRIREISKALLLSAPFCLIGCIAESNSESLDEENSSDIAQDLQNSTDIESSSSEPPRPSDNMSYGNLFQGGEADFYMHSGFEEDESAGKWYVTNDNDIGGQSNVFFPVPLKQPDYFEDNISYCGGFCDTIKIVGNISTPYAGIGVNLVNKEQKGADITDWGGLVIDYVSTQHPLTIALVPEGVTDIRQFYHYDLPACPGHRAIRWSEFSQVDNRQRKRDKEEDLKHIAALQFVVGGQNGEETFVNIKSLGTFYLREGEAPHKFEPASSSFYMEQISAASNADTASSSSSEAISVASSESAPSSSSTNIPDEASSAASSNAEGNTSSSSLFEQSSSSSEGTIYSLGEAAFPPSSSSQAESSSSKDILSSSSAFPQWPGFNGDNGGWGGWGGF